MKKLPTAVRWALKIAATTLIALITVGAAMAVNARHPLPLINPPEEG